MIHHNDHFIFKIMCLFVGSVFLVSHRRLYKPRHFYSLSSLGTMSDHNWWVFHPRGGSTSACSYPAHVFYLSFQSIVRFCCTLSHLPSSPNQTPNTVSIYQPTHTQLNAMSPCICKAKMSLYECYMRHLLIIFYT